MGRQSMMSGAIHTEVMHEAPDCLSGVCHKDLLRLMHADSEHSAVLIPAVVSLLEERIMANDKAVQRPGESFKMNITIREFLGRIIKYSNASPCNYAIGLIFLERLKKMEGPDAPPLLTSKTYQRTVLGAIMLACKYLDDFYYSNKHWAQIGGIPTKELNEIEMNLLNKLNFKLHIQREEYDWYVEELYSRAKREGLKPLKEDDIHNANTKSHATIGTDSSSSATNSSAFSMFFHSKPKMGNMQMSEESLSAMSTPRGSVGSFVQPSSGPLSGPLSTPRGSVGSFVQPSSGPLSGPLSTPRGSVGSFVQPSSGPLSGPLFQQGFLSQHRQEFTGPQCPVYFPMDPSLLQSTHIITPPTSLPGFVQTTLPQQQPLAPVFEPLALSTPRHRVFV